MRRFAILARPRWPNSSPDSGTRGHRGYSGDYLFAWLGWPAAPFDKKVWAMAQLGEPTLLFPHGQQRRSDAGRPRQADCSVRCSSCRFTDRLFRSSLSSSSLLSMVVCVACSGTATLTRTKWCSGLDNKCPTAGGTVMRAVNLDQDSPYGGVPPQRAYAVLYNL